MQREELRNYLDMVLEVPRFKDYCPNGLQVEGRSEVALLVCGVTASQALIDRAIERKADGILVHHGYFWKGEDSRITGVRKARLGALIKNDINLYAYHLPLDAHPLLGNNAQLAAVAGWQITGTFADQAIGFLGKPSGECNARQLADHLGVVLQRSPLLVGDSDRLIRTIAWCTGGAQSYFEEAVEAGADVFVSGEISEQTTHLAKELGIPYIAAGHHATERYGVQALGAHLQEKCGITCVYEELDNPV